MSVYHCFTYASDDLYPIAYLDSLGYLSGLDVRPLATAHLVHNRRGIQGETIDVSGKRELSKEKLIQHSPV